MPKNEKESRQGKVGFKTMFRDPTYQKYADIVSFKDPGEAIASVDKLGFEYDKAKTLKKKLTIARVVQFSANLSISSSKRGALSDKERKELLQIHDIYGDAAKDTWKNYRSDKEKMK